MNKNEERDANGFQWPVIIKNPNAHANIDYYYGPYDSLADLREHVPNELWVPGFTAAVQDGGGVVKEYWVVGEGRSANWEEKHSTPEGYFRLMGILSSGEKLSDIKNPALGDVWFLTIDDPETEGDLYKEYVFLGDGMWEQLGQAQLDISMSTLTVKLPDSVTKTYNGMTEVTIDLSDIATKTQLNDVKKDLEQTISNTKTDMATEISKLPKFDNNGLGLLVRDNSTNIVKAYKGNGWEETGVKTLKTSTEIRANVNGSPENIFLVNSKGLFQGTNYRSSNYYHSYRANPFVLGIELRPNGSSYDFENATMSSFYHIVYNPYSVNDPSIKRTDIGCYTITHDLLDKGVFRNPDGETAESEANEYKRYYSIIGNAAVGTYNKDRKPLWFSVVERHRNKISFCTSDASGLKDFSTCFLMFYEYSEWYIKGMSE